MVGDAIIHGDLAVRSTVMQRSRESLGESGDDEAVIPWSASSWVA